VQARSSFFRPALLAAAVLVLLAIVALASRSERPARPSSAADRSLPVEFWDYLITFGVLAMVGVIALAILMKVPMPERQQGRFGFSQLLGVVVIAGLVAAAGTKMQWPTVPQEEAGVDDVVIQAGTEETPEAEIATSADEPRRGEFRWEVFVAAGGLLLLGAGAYLVRRRLARGEGLDERTRAASDLSAVLDESVDDLRAERDPRRAVIAAYARMERVLAGHGFPRFRSEAPLEYLARVLRELSVRTSAVLALTELFERAKFSRHEIDSEMKDEAIGALIAVRNDLQAAVTP
jgi:hypothetical protein